MIKHPEIYKRTSTGAIQTWCAEIEGSRYRTISGQVNGVKTPSGWVQCEPKNVGKANEVSADEQARREVEALYKKKLRQDFKADIVAIDEATRFKPMLAEKWADHADRFDDTTAFVFEPKLDGFRCIATKDGLWTRDGLKIPTAPHIEQAIAPIVSQGYVLDGELYNHELRNDFNTISSILRKKKPTEADLIRSMKYVEYHVYDLPSAGSEAFVQRSARLREIVRTINSPYVVSVPQVVGRADIAVGCLEQFLADGYEGAMAKVANATYDNKRSKSLLKLKKLLDEEFLITDIIDGRGSRSGIAARAVAVTAEGKEFEAGIIGDHVYCKSLLDNKDAVVGTMSTFQFLNYTPGGIPRGAKLKLVDRGLW